MDDRSNVPDMTESLTTDETAAILNVSPRTVRRMAERGQLEAQRVADDDGRPRWLISARSIEQMPKPDRSGPRGQVRTFDVVPVGLYQELFTRWEAATIELGRVYETRERLQIAEKSLSTVADELRTTTAERDQLKTELAYAQRRRWYRRRQRLT